MTTKTTQLSTPSFFNNIVSIAKAAGSTVVGKALTLYYCALDSDTPAWAVTTISASLVYFINPIDAMPDVLPMGFTDDLGVLAVAFGTVAAHVKSEHTQRAKKTIQQWFGT